jgi:hypothetical protein
MGRSKFGNFLRDFTAAYGVTNGLVRDVAMGQAANVKPEESESTTLNETTPDRENMAYDSDTGQYLPKYLGKNSQPTEQAQAQLNTPADGTSESPDGVLPSFTAKTAKSYKMGNKVQDTPFSQEQVDAQRFRNQADVSSRFGNFRDAAALQGLAKTRDEEGVTSQIRAGAMEGLKNTQDMKDEEKMFSISKGMYEQALKLNRPDLAAGYYNQMTTNRDVLLNRANERADRVYRATGNLSGYVDSYNRYVADGMTIDAFKRNEDGSHVFTMNDGTGKTRDIAVPKEKTQEYLMALRDPKRMAELEAKRAEILFKASADAQEQLNKPVAVGKDQTLVVPSTGQTFSPGNARGFDPKEAGQVLDDTRKILLERSGNFDQATGKWNWSPETTTKAVVAERLFMKNPTLGPSQLADIADNGKTGIAEIEVGGKRQKVQAVTHNGNTYLLGGGDVGHATPGAPGKAAAPQGTTTGLGTRDVRGKISPAPSAPGLTPIAPQRKAEPVAYNAPELDKLAVAAAEETGVPPKLLLAVKNAGEKSNNDQVSKKGAAGVMQFMPETAKAYGVDPTNPESAIRGAGRYLADLIKQYRGNVAAAVAHYNGGSTQGTLVAAGKEPTYPETRAYLERVLAAAG